MHTPRFGSLQALLGAVYDQGASDLLDDLITLECAAGRWRITIRAARTHVVAMHARYGATIGYLLDDDWVVRASAIAAYPPETEPT